MSRLVCHQHDRVGSWVMSRCGSEWYPGRGTTLGVEDSSGNLIAGVIYEAYNGTNCFMHCAAREGVKFIPRAFLHAIFHFPFIENHCQRITGLVDSGNLKAQRVDEALGWVREGVIAGAGLNGNDIIIYKMTPADCNWLTEEEKNGLC